MLTLTPKPPQDEQEALLAVINRIRRFPVARSLLAVVAAIFAWSAVTLLLAPDSQLFTQGTQPAFTLFPPPVWAAAYAAGGLAAVCLLRAFTVPRMFATWLTVFPVQTVWLAASGFAVSRGGGSALGVVFFTGLILFTVITAVVVAVDYTSGKR